MMTENKRYSLDFEECDAIWIDDNVENKSYTIRNDTIKEKELEEIVDELNNLADENETLKFELSKHIGDGEWDIRDITCGAGKFRLEEWGERYHQFYDGDTELEDEAVVIMLLENKKLIEELKERIKELEYQLDVIDGLYASDQEDMSHPFRLDYKEVLNR